MLKFAVTVGIVAALLLAALAYVSARFADQKEIIRVTAERDELRAGREALNARVRGLEQEQAQLNETIKQKDMEIATNKTEIDRLEREKDEARLTVRRLRTSDDEVAAFAEAFPELAAARNFGVTDIFDDANRVTIRYLCLPVEGVETFIDHQTAMTAYEAEIKKYKQNEALYGSVIELKDHVLALETEKSTAFRDEYNKVFDRYEDVNGKYIKLLEQPRFKLPGLGMSIGIGVLGIAIGAGL